MQCSSNQLLSGKKSTKNGLSRSWPASNSRHTPLKPIPKEHFIQYPSCEWKHSFPQNATTELPALQIHHAWLHPATDCMRCCSCSGIGPITCQIKMSNGYSHQLWEKTKEWPFMLDLDIQRQKLNFSLTFLCPNDLRAYLQLGSAIQSQAVTWNCQNASLNVEILFLFLLSAKIVA